MKYIQLTKGKKVIVDNKDFHWLSQWKWLYNGSGYASRSVRTKSKIIIIYMHRLINKTPDNLFTDHINRNSLDNRRINLRSVTHSENILNQKKKKTNPLNHKGVTQRGKDFIARFRGKYLGTFTSEKLAANAYGLAGGLQ